MPGDEARPFALTLLAAQAVPSFVLALALSLYATPIARAAALRFGIVDKPDGKLKTHASAVPYLGGLAIYGSFLVAMALSLTLGFDRRLLGILLGGSILVIVGLIDDLGSLPYGAKFLGELVAGLVAVRSGVVVELHYLHGAPAEIALNATASVFWLVLVTNAVNLIDVMDGLAASVSAVACAALLVVAGLNQRPEVLCATAALAGALVGFLRYNRHPAAIYMGDTGALFAGFMMGALCLVGSYGHASRLAFLTPVYVLLVPLLDTGLVSALRVARRQSPFRGSPDHFALRLRHWGLSVPATVRAAAAAGLLGASAGLLNLWLNGAAAVALAVAMGALALGAAAWLSRIPVVSPVGRGLVPRRVGEANDQQKL